MLRVLADEDFDHRILKAFRRIEPSLDWVRVQDIGLSGSSDESVLQRAADDRRVVLSHDVSTMIAAAHTRLERNLPMPGLIVVSHRMAIGHAGDELLWLALESNPNEWEGQVIYLPLQK
jgi:hypothetical protein